jgi:two-component system response regulator ArlR
MDNLEVLIIEDEKEIAEFLKLELTHEGYIVNSIYDGTTGLAEALSHEYNLIILDISLPGINGIEVCRRIRKNSNIPIIMLTAKDSLIDKVIGLDSGANDYITKPFFIEELLARIRAVLRNTTDKPENDTLTIDNITISISSRQVTRNNEIIPLSKKEFNLLEYLVKNLNIVLTRDQILETIWGYSYEGETNVVDVYVKHLREKIETPDSPKIIHTVRGVGYAARVQ